MDTPPLGSYLVAARADWLDAIDQVRGRESRDEWIAGAVALRYHDLTCTGAAGEPSGSLPTAPIIHRGWVDGKTVRQEGCSFPTKSPPSNRCGNWGSREVLDGVWACWQHWALIRGAVFAAERDEVAEVVGDRERSLAELEARVAELRAQAEAAEDRIVGAEAREGSFVYFAALGRYVKIGWTRRLESRLQSLSSPKRGGAAHPADLPAGPVTLLAAFRGDDRLEQQLHWKFQDLRATGEWFRRHPDIDGYLAEMGGALHGPSL